MTAVAEHVEGTGRLSTLDRLLPVWIGIAMIVGVLLGFLSDEKAPQVMTLVDRCISRAGHIQTEADGILIPEVRFDLDEVARWVESRFRSHYAPIIVVAEGAQPTDGHLVTKDQSLDAFGHVKLSGIGDWLASGLEARTGKEARASILGHIQRGGTPTAFDRVLATRFGLHAVDAIAARDYGTMVALRGTEIVRVPLIEGTGELKTVPPHRYDEVKVFFG